MESKEYAIVFKALSDPKRVCILQMLTKEAMCGCRLLEAFKITQPTLSHHMRILCDSGLVLCKKRGKYIDYSLNIEKINGVKEFFATVGTKRPICDDCGNRF